MKRTVICLILFCAGSAASSQAYFCTREVGTEIKSERIRGWEVTSLEESEKYIIKFNKNRQKLVWHSFDVKTGLGAISNCDWDEKHTSLTCRGEQHVQFDPTTGRFVSFHEGFEDWLVGRDVLLFTNRLAVEMGKCVKIN